MKLIYLGSLFMLVCLGCSKQEAIILENDFEALELGSYIEPDFPFISGYVDLRSLREPFSIPDNVVARGMMLNLGDSAFACFDMDLLRWSVCWTGQPLSGLLPQISYQDFFNKENGVPEISGDPKFVTGVYPGWSVGSPSFKDVRGEDQSREGYHWGPIPEKLGRWNGVHVYGDKALLSYRIGETSIVEMPGCEGGAVFTRTFRVGASDKSLFLHVGEVANARIVESGRNKAKLSYNSDHDTIAMIGILGEEAYEVKLVDDRYMVVEVPAARSTREFTVLFWRGDASAQNIFEEAYAQNATYQIPAYEQGGQAHWRGSVLAKGKISPDTSAFVTDRLTLPIPNPWKRNVRVVDVAFFGGHRAAVVTFSGDVWIVDGITSGLERLSWKRFASGLFEPMSIVIRDSQIYVFGKEGIVRLHDINGDQEADYYENFCNLMHQSAESYEWASDMVLTPEGDFFISKGGAVSARPGLTKKLLPGFRAGSNHGGTVLKVSGDGRTVERYATGLRAPFLGLNSGTGQVSVTDQQGHFVPSTPIYLLEKDDFFGVPATFYDKDTPDIKLPLTWIPHRIDRSAGGQTWITSETMGPLNNRLIHFSFGRPGLFSVFVDTTSQGLQGGVSFIPSDYPVPTFKGEVNPADGKLYIAGFNLFGSNSKGISTLQRLRYTGQPSYMVNHVKVGKQGIVLTFDSPLQEASIHADGSFRVKRWNYKRTEMYGSGHFNLQGQPGEEILPVLDRSLSKDRKSVFLLVPDLRVVDQMEIFYSIRAETGNILSDGVWFTVHYLDDLDVKGLGIEEVDLSKLNISTEVMTSMIVSDAPITVESGREIFRKMGCIGCHSTDGTSKGMYGPSIKRSFGSKRELTDGSTITIDEAYLRESILAPEKKVVKGYSAEMPSFAGILSETDIEALIVFIKRQN